MQLRDHPLMSYRGNPNWPPTWVKTVGSQYAALRSLRGEIGVLSEALLSRVYPYTRCYLIMDFEGESYMGTLIFEDAAFCRQLCGLLQNHIAKPIKEIGDLDLSHTL
jgi:hypothetical protein